MCYSDLVVTFEEWSQESRSEISFNCSLSAFCCTCSINATGQIFKIIKGREYKVPILWECLGGSVSGTSDSGFPLR